MNRKFTDEQIDQMMRKLISDASLDDAAINDIADSPQMLWAVKRQIASQKQSSVSPWPPVNAIRRWLMIGVPVAAAAALVISFVVFKPANEVGVAGVIPVNNVAAGQPKTMDTPSVVEPVVAKTDSKQRAEKHLAAIPTKFVAKKRQVDRVIANSTTATTPKTEIKTDFIALSYARSPESGQIVRVKVPSSMMVTLGLVASVEQPANLVDAEVLVGDDGLSRAIRFIR